MKKIIVIGCPGSGKSTFASRLHKITRIPLFHLDMMYWNADGTSVEKSVFLSRLQEALEKDAWIIDGNYGATMEERIAACDTVFFLDYPKEVCLDGVRERIGKPRQDMPWIETKEDAEFMDFIRNFEKDSRKSILDLLIKYSQKSIFILKDRSEGEALLSSLEQA